MKRIVDVYVESVSGSGNYSKLELFNDEKIEITSSIQNIQDISKVYTDFTQSFTIPASPINNAILHHFYQSDVDVATTNGVYQWNFNFRIRARIEVGLTSFRTGTIMVEKSEIKNGRPDNYTITFYGDLVSLKDKFGNSKLSDLDLTAYNADYTATDVINSVTSSTQLDVMYPLITSKRVWTYNDGLSTDIKTSSGAIRYNELFQALKVNRIFEAIETKFNIQFNSQFFTSTNEKWDKLYLWLKNQEEYKFITSPITADITSPSGQLGTGTDDAKFYFDTTANTFTCQSPGPKYGTQRAELKISISSTTNTNVIYYIDLYKDGNVIQTYAKSGVTSPVQIYKFSTIDINSVFEIKVRAEDIITLKLNATLSSPVYLPSQSKFVALLKTIEINTITTTAKIDIASKMPDITISDFFSGILKMFNATCYATDANTFIVEPLDLWYNKGAIYDITEFTDTDSIDINRANIFKKLSFKYQKSESFINRRFYDTNIMDREYSDTSLVLSNEGSDFTIELPFESLLMDNKNIDDFQVGYCLTKEPDFKPYIPKPVFVYYNGRINDTLYLNNGSTSTLYTDFNIFSNVLEVDNVKYSLTWHPENDVKAPNLPLENNLYSLYYGSYLQNLFNPKCRLVRVKAHFPLSLITKLKLNDRLIIRDKRYIINELKTDITSGEVNLSLINDFRPMVNNAVIDTIIVDDAGDTFPIDWEFANGVSSTAFSSSIGGVSFSPSTITESTTIDVTIPANTNTPTPIVTESGTDTLITDDGWGIVNEEGAGVVIPIYATNTNFDGTTSIYDFYLTQS